MKTGSFGINTHIQGEVTTLARVWSITRKDAETLYFTDHDQPITYDGNVYEAAFGFEASAVQQAIGTGTNSVSIEFLLSEDTVTEDDIRRGMYSNSVCTIDVINWKEPQTNGVIRLFKGDVDSVTVTDKGYARIDLSGLTAGRRTMFMEKFSQNCRADFGDDRCKYPIETIAADCYVTDEGDGELDFDVTLGLPLEEQEEQDAVTPPTRADNAFNDGTIVWATGNNAGYAMEIMKSFSSGRIILFVPMFQTIQAGDIARLYPGCDKQFNGGCRLYNNRVNFRGEPFAYDPSKKFSGVGKKEWLTAGSFPWVVPEYTTMTVQVVGGGGPGWNGGEGPTPDPNPGQTGGSSSFNGQLFGHGGQAGIAENYGRQGYGGGWAGIAGSRGRNGQDGEGSYIRPFNDYGDPVGDMTLPKGQGGGPGNKWRDNRRVVDGGEGYGRAIFASQLPGRGGATNARLGGMGTPYIFCVAGGGGGWVIHEYIKGQPDAPVPGETITIIVGAKGAGGLTAGGVGPKDGAVYANWS